MEQKLNTSGSIKQHPHIGCHKAVVLKLAGSSLLALGVVFAIPSQAGWCLTVRGCILLVCLGCSLAACIAGFIPCDCARPLLNIKGIRRVLAILPASSVGFLALISVLLVGGLMQLGESTMLGISLAQAFLGFALFCDSKHFEEMR